MPPDPPTPRRNDASYCAQCTYLGSTKAWAREPTRQRPPRAAATEAAGRLLDGIVLVVVVVVDL